MKLSIVEDNPFVSTQQEAFQIRLSYQLWG